MQLENLRKILDCDGIIFLSYGGLLTQDLIVGMTNALEEESKSNELKMGVSVNILTIFIELSQNIMNYSKKSSLNKILNDSKGMVFVGYKEDDNQYFICSQNLITKADKEKIEPKIEQVSALDKVGLKELYRSLRKNGKQKHDKGAGFGFVEIARRCDKIEYEFMPENDDFFYTIKLYVDNK